MRIACIGSRNLSAENLEKCETLGTLISANGWELHTGNTPGAEQAFAEGANNVDPATVSLHLPWRGFHKDRVVEGNSVFTYPFGGLRFYTDIAASQHLSWTGLNSSSRKILTRDVSTLLPEQSPVNTCIYWGSKSRKSEGLDQSIRVAISRGIFVIKLSPRDFPGICSYILSIKSIITSIRKRGEPRGTEA